ncbi:MAG: beta-lactamase family protein [Croceitalea sp.]|nr:beta-lactamase family protein [Croceitalea sp.]
MKRNLLWVMIFVFIHTGHSQLATPRIDSIVNVQTVQNRFEGVILIAEKGEIQYHWAYGFSDEAMNQEIDVNTAFGIASITKMLTAIIILQLVGEEKLNLSDSVGELLPSLNIPSGNKITVHHLLLHISGLPNEQDYLYQNKLSPIEFVAKTLGNTKKLKNFGKFNYANIDYVLLGIIASSLENKSWKDLVKERIIKKLSLTKTGFLSKDVKPENFAYSFQFNKKGERVKDSNFYIENFNAAGCMYSTTADLLQIDQAMYGNDLLSDELKKLMYTSYPEYNYSGYSVWTYNYPFLKNAPLLMERRGGILGANSTLVRFLNSNKTLIILNNNGQFNPDSFGDMNNLKESLIMEIGK